MTDNNYNWTGLLTTNLYHVLSHSNDIKPQSQYDAICKYF